MSAVQSTPSASDIFASINATGKKTPTSSTATAEDAQNRFLTLLVTQLKNQDPLNPLDNAQMTSQLAQMSTVTGIEKLNTTLASLVDGLGDTQAMQASEMIGKTVLVPGSSLSLSKGAAYGGVNLASAADQVTVSILNSSGKVIQTESLGAQKAGVINFAWDGATSPGAAATDGAYTFKVEAVQGSNAVTATALQFGTVSALARTTSGFQLDLGALGKFGFDDVQQVL
jgi:flagellar basal-body rod modification protein FlgD